MGGWTVGTLGSKHTSFIYLLLRESARAPRGGTERDTQNPKQAQALSCQHRARREGWNAQTVRSGPEPKLET